MNREEAIAECKKLWREIEASGFSKAEFSFTDAGKQWRRKAYKYNCPLCEYVAELLGGKDPLCSLCLLADQYEAGQGFRPRCVQLGFKPFSRPSKQWLSYIEGLK